MEFYDAELRELTAKVRVLSHLLGYCDAEELFDGGVPTDFFRGFSSILWDMSKEIDMINTGLYPDKEED